MAPYSMRNTLSELKSAAIERHGSRAGAICAAQFGKFTKANWLKVIAEPVDEYAEAEHEEWRQQLMVAIRTGRFDLLEIE